MHTMQSEHAGTLGCAAATRLLNTCVVQQQYGKAVPIHQTSAMASVCRKALKGFTRLGPKHRDLNTCCNILLIPRHSAAWSETGKKLMSSRSRSTCPCCSQTSTPAAGFSMYAWAKPQYATPGDMQAQPAKPGDPAAIVTGRSVSEQRVSCLVA